MRRKAAPFLSLLAAAGFLALAATSASATVSHPFLTSFAGSGANALTTPTSVAVDDSAGPSAGDVYVTDTTSKRVEKFDSAGNFILMFGKGVNQTTGGDVCPVNPGDVCQAGSSGSAAGQFTTPTFVAVDSSSGPSAGDVYVADTSTFVVQKFAPDGSLITSWGGTPAGGQLDGSTATGGPFGPIGGITVDASGNLEVLNDGTFSTPSRLFKFAQDGTFIESFAVGYGANTFGLALDSAGNIFKLFGGSSTASEGGTVRFAPDGTNPVYVPATGGGGGGTGTGIATYTAANDLYIDNGSYIARYHFNGSGQVVLSDGSTCTPAQYTGCGVTDTFGFDTTLTRARGLTVTASGKVYVADTGDRRVAVFVRLPEAETGPASNLSQTAATISGHVDPAGGPNVTECHFDYSPPSGPGQTAACLDSGNTVVGTVANPIAGPLDVHADINGLTPATAYEYRLVAGTGSGVDARGSNLTFTTLPDPPTVITTAGATGIGPYGATLDGTVNPNSGNVSDCHFEYGETTAYGSQAACASPPGAGASPVGVSAEVSGLTPSTTYHFRLFATNAGGTTEGSDQEFTTLPPPPTVITTPGGTAITQTAANVAGSVNPNSTNVANCHFEYGTNLSYGSQATCASLPGAGPSPVGVSASLSGLAANTIYHFRLVATNALGSTTYGSDQEFTTLPDPPTALAAGAATTQTAATLAGTVNPNSNPVSDCHIDYGATASYGQSVACAPANPGSGAHPVDVSASLSGLSANTTYHFRVVATNAGGTADSSDQAFTTLPPSPAVTTSPGATGIGPYTASVAGTVNPNSGDVSDCHFEYGETTAYGSQAACASLPGAGASPVDVSASLSGLSADTTYHFRLVAANAGGTTPGSDQTFTTAAAQESEAPPPLPPCSKGYVRKHGTCVRKPCRKGFVRKHGKCVRKPHHHKHRHHKHRHG